MIEQTKKDTTTSSRVVVMDARSKGPLILIPILDPQDETNEGERHSKGVSGIGGEARLRPLE